MFLIEERPADAKSKKPLIDGVVGCEEAFATTSIVDVTRHNKESGILQLEVGIKIEYRIAASLCPHLSILLNSELSH